MTDTDVPDADVRDAGVPDAGETDPSSPVGGPDDVDREDDGDDGGIPALLLVAFQDRMHVRRFSDPDEPGHIRTVLGEAGNAVAFVDDGPDHCMIGRPVGWSPDGCVYFLVARISLYGYEQMRDGEIALADAFSDARDISLCGIFESEGTVQNVMVARHYRRAEKVPADYLPPSAFLEFEDAPADEE